MNLDAAVKPLSDAFGGRFVLVNYLPAYGAALFFLVLVWAGAPGELRFSRAWTTAGNLGLGEVLLLAVALTIVSAVTQPLQLGLVRLVEGYWPRWLTWLDKPLREAQQKRRQKLVDAAALPDPPETLTQEDLNRIGRAGARLRERYPAEDAVRATAFGNALAAGEAHAGARFGWDAVVAWPRLYPVLGARTREIVDDRRDILDISIRLCVVFLLTGLVAIVLLAGSGWWIFLALLPIAIGLLAYRAAVQAAMAYGEAVDAAFDLHRFDLLVALHQPLPTDPAAERTLAHDLCKSWRQGQATTSPYDHHGPK
ncbi:hypothetical protein AB0E69_19960 [Kribbella sp. NPDC026611]|uniref:hypothetical protein n=1 Tax=Kribbella sp. NPDC026611 TaxID=3154911 RepID=UPI0033C3E589